MVKFKFLKAYSLIEVLVVMAVFFMMGFLALPAAIREIQVGRTDSFVKEIRSAILLTSQDAFSGKAQKSYGIALFNDHYTIFTGESLATAEETLEIYADRTVTINTITLTGGTNEIVYSPNEIRPNVHGSFNVSDAYANYKFTLNREGLLILERL
jgi:type II secretory pathway pseudopilin PulG